MSDSTQLVPAAPRHQAPASQGTKSALGRHQVVTTAIQPAKKPPTELVQPTRALSRITPFRVIDLPDGKMIYEFWKIGCAPTRSMRSALNDPKVARQCAYITVSGDKQSFQLGFFPNGEPGQVVKNLPVSQLPQAVDDLILAGFQGTLAESAAETLRISV